MLSGTKWVVSRGRQQNKGFMNNNRLRVVGLAILISIMMILFCPLGQKVCYAAVDKDFTVSFDDPEWEYKEYSYTDVQIVKKDSTKTSHIGTISISTTGGYISSLPGSPILPANASWSTDLGETINEKLVHQTAICVLEGTNDNITDVINIIKNVKFMIKNYTDKISVSILVDGQTTKLKYDDTNLGDYKITAGTGSLEGHYYVFVPCDPNIAKDSNNDKNMFYWKNAYNAAKSLRLMGMQGYLVTITEDAEDRILDKITTGGAWAGAVRVPDSLSNSSLNGDTVWTGFDLPTDSSHSIWKWVCGPEAGNTIKITGGYSALESWSHVIDPNPPDCAYSNWNRADPADPDYDEKGNEPNNYYDEYCMSVHYKSNGEQSTADEKRLGWNDWPNEPNTGIAGPYIDGYFVEFSGLEIEQHAESVLVVDSNREYTPHKWNYEVKPNSTDTLEVSCIEDTHPDCIYKDKAAEVVINAPSRDYDTNSYDGVTVTADGMEDISYFGLVLGDNVIIKYVGRDGTTYSETTTAPSDAGYYTAKAYIKISDDEYKVIQKDFAISKVNLTIILNDQTVKRGDPIDKKYGESDIGDGKGLIKEITGLKGDAGSEDKLDSILSSSIKADTSIIGTTEDGITIDEPYNGTGHTIVLKDSTGTKDVTDNYNITVIPGDLYVGMKTPDVIYPDPSAQDLVYGQKLKESVITGHYKDPTGGQEVSGTFTWDSPDIFPEVKDSKDGATPKDFEATFTPDDDATYTPVSVKIQINIIPKSIPDNIDSGDAKEITADVSVDMSNKAKVSLFDKQTNKYLIKGTDYTVTETVDDTTRKVKIIIKGIGNYKDEFTVYKDAHVWTGRVITEENYDDSAKEMNPVLSKVSIDNGTRIFLDKIGKLDQSNPDYQKTREIVSEITDSPTHESTKGDYRALITVYISNADGDLTSPSEKSCARSAIGAVEAGKTIVPADAEIGMYFDVSMDIQYYVEDTTTNPYTKLIEKTLPVHDTSSAVFLPDGFKEKVTVSIPERLKPAKNHTRKYYIIRVHDENNGSGTTSYKYTVMPYTQSKQNKYELTFETDKFSKYAIAYTDTSNSGKKDDPKPTPKPEPKKESSGSSGNSGSTVTAPVNNAAPVMPTTVQVASPKTGDTSDMTLAIIMILTGMILLVVSLTAAFKKKL